ncbi:MAG: hypothetical protein MUF01_05505 [Bryobacterales bacterium]|nr:hypothetical protein [Bryobacterales bacterium]
MDANPPNPPQEPEAPGLLPSAVKVTLSGRSFSFYPPIRNLSHNEWRFVRETWSELLVENVDSGVEVWIPRRMLGAISSVEQPFPIVGLDKEMEFRAGAVWPYRPKLLEMPRPERTPQPEDASVANATGLLPTRKRRGSGSTATEHRLARLIGIALTIAFVAILLVLAIFRGDGIFGNRVILQTADQDYLSLGAGDDYFRVVQRLGPPQSDRWRTQSKEVAFRVLEYPDRAYSVILFGADQATATYLGAMDGNWRPIHAVSIGRGMDSTAMLRTLPRF